MFSWQMVHKDILGDSLALPQTHDGRQAQANTHRETRTLQCCFFPVTRSGAGECSLALAIAICRPKPSEAQHAKGILAARPVQCLGCVFPLPPAATGITQHPPSPRLREYHDPPPLASKSLPHPQCRGGGVRGIPIAPGEHLTSTRGNTTTPAPWFLPAPFVSADFHLCGKVRVRLIDLLGRP